MSKIDGVAVPPDVNRLMAPGFKGGEIRRIIAMGDEGGPRSAWRR